MYFARGNVYIGFKLLCVAYEVILGSDSIYNLSQIEDEKFSAHEYTLHGEDIV